MKNSANPKSIGAFVSAAILLLIGLLGYFGSVRFGANESSYILYFDQSINGLTVGSPVKFRGVPIGKVSRILLRAKGQPENSNAIPVIVNIDADYVQRQLFDNKSRTEGITIEDLLRRGMVARLNLESVITGLLFVEFSIDTDTDTSIEHRISKSGDLIEIPTVISSLDEITEDFARIIAKVAEMDLNEIEGNINALIVSSTNFLNQIDTNELSVSITNAAKSFTAVVESGELKNALATLQSTLDEAKTTIATYNLNSGALAQDLPKVMEQFSHTLLGLNALIASGESALSSETGLLNEFEQSLRELRLSAQSLRSLLDYIERNPGSLIRGRSQEAP